MRIYLHIVALAMCFIGALALVATINANIPPIAGLTGTGVCLVSLWGSVECLKELE